HLELRVLLLELLELVEVACEFLVEDVGDAVNRLSGGEPSLVIGPGGTLAELVGLEAAPLLIDVPERVLDVRQLARHPGGVQVLHLKITGVDAPLGEICDRLARSDRSRGRSRSRSRPWCWRRRRRRRGARPDQPPWAIDAGIGRRVLILSPPLGFVDDAVQARALASRKD